LPVPASRCYRLRMVTAHFPCEVLKRKNELEGVALWVVPWSALTLCLPACASRQRAHYMWEVYDVNTRPRRTPLGPMQSTISVS
ncbi:MAG: hypothetical protein ACYTFZ_01995, partial [Planctomycetota bacterium]